MAADCCARGTSSSSPTAAAAGRQSGSPRGDVGLVHCGPVTEPDGARVRVVADGAATSLVEFGQTLRVAVENHDVVRREQGATVGDSHVLAVGPEYAQHVHPLVRQAEFAQRPRGEPVIPV